MNKQQKKTITNIFFKIFYSENFEETFDSIAFCIETECIYVSLISKKQIDFDLYFDVKEEKLNIKVCSEIFTFEENKKKYVFDSIFDALNFCKKIDDDFFSDSDYVQDQINKEISKLKNY